VLRQFGCDDAGVRGPATVKALRPRTVGDEFKQAGGLAARNPERHRNPPCIELTVTCATPARWCRWDGSRAVSPTRARRRREGDLNPATTAASVCWRTLTASAGTENTKVVVDRPEGRVSIRRVSISAASVAAPDRSANSVTAELAVWRQRARRLQSTWRVHRWLCSR
jgi:hypothetical protein